MGCIHSCTCGGMCPGCSDYQPEAYCGDAEDRLARQLGFRDYDDHMAYYQQQEEARQQDMEGPEEQQPTSQGQNAQSSASAIG